MYKKDFSIKSREFTTAGEASGIIKKTLKQLGLNDSLIKKASIIAYEAEMNIVIHSYGGFMTLEVYPDMLRLTARDTGPGIPNIDQAMQEGFSTAPDEIRELGFGAGMGLPNIKRCSDEFSIETGKEGTILVSKIRLR